MRATVPGVAAALVLLVGMSRASEPAAPPPSPAINTGVYRDTTNVESPEAALRRLVAAALGSGTISENATLVDLLGRYGLEPLNVTLRTGVRDGLDLFALPLIQAQATAYRPNWDVQLLFLEVGTPEQRTRMTTQLQRWFTEEVREAPRQGPTRVEGDATRQVIQDCRAAAAEMLAEFGDRTAGSAIRRWMDQGSIDAAQRERAVRALARLDNPCQGRWLMAEGAKDVALCPGAGLITVKACWYMDGRSDCGEPVPIESARYLARTIRLQSVRLVHAPTVSTLALMVTGKSDFDVRIFPADDARSIYVVERDMQASGLAWRADSPELAKWVIGWFEDGAAGRELIPEFGGPGCSGRWRS